MLSSILTVNANSIKKYMKLPNDQPATANPTIPQATLLAKEIKGAVNVKAGVTNPDVSDFFDDEKEKD